MVERKGEVTRQERLATRVAKARRIAEMGLCSITSRDGDGKAKTVTVPGSDGKRYQVIIRRHNGHWTTECRREAGAIGYTDCPGNVKTVCYHSFAAIFAAGLDNGCRVHSVTESLKAAGRLKRLVKNKAVIKGLRSHQDESKRWFHLVVVSKRKSAKQDIVDLFGEG